MPESKKVTKRLVHDGPLISYRGRDAFNESKLKELKELKIQNDKQEVSTYSYKLIQAGP